MKVFKHKNVEDIVVVRKSRRSWTYRCIHCGAPDSGRVNYVETFGGQGDLVDLSGDWENGEQSYDSDIDVTDYECSECGERRSSLINLFTEEEEEDEDL